VKIRAGFVSNSSSTSFLIISRKELNEADFMRLMGISPGSPLTPVFRQLFQDVIEQTDKHMHFATTPKEMPVETWFDDRHVSERMLQKLREAQQEGLHAYYGLLSSDNNNVQTFFCTDSFEIENESIYFNGLACVW